MLYRKIENSIREWLEDGGNALFISGARKVGKTFSIRRCLGEHKESTGKDWLELDLSENPELTDILIQSESLSDLFLNMSLALSVVNIENRLIFIDCAGLCPGIVGKVMSWSRRGGCRFIVSGVSFDEDPSEYVRSGAEYLTMFPLDFEEFLYAKGMDTDAMDRLRNKYRDTEPLAEAAHKRLTELFGRYLLVGGMPEAVEKELETGDLSLVSAVHERILDIYRNDQAAADAKDKKLHTAGMYQVLPMELMKTNRRFRYADIDKTLKAGRAEPTLKWHEAYGDVISVYSVSKPRAPLSYSRQDNLLKLYASDVGLLSRMYADAGYEKDNPYTLCGLYENAVARELKSHGCHIYYYMEHTLGELDFLIEHEGDPLPIEVKSGKDFYRHSAVKHVTGSWELRIPRSIVLYDGNVSRKGDIVYYPIYMAMFIRERGNR